VLLSNDKLNSGSRNCIVQSPNPSANLATVALLSSNPIADLHYGDHVAEKFASPHSRFRFLSMAAKAGAGDQRLKFSR
jgi:hypothetical protein